MPKSNLSTELVNDNCTFSESFRKPRCSNTFAHRRLLKGTMRRQHKECEGVALLRRISPRRGARFPTVRPPGTPTPLRRGHGGNAAGGGKKNTRKRQKYLQMAALRAVHGESQVMPEPKPALPSPQPPGAPGPPGRSRTSGGGRVPPPPHGPEPQV